jgi:hypothetical protein
MKYLWGGKAGGRRGESEGGQDQQVLKLRGRRGGSREAPELHGTGKAALRGTSRGRIGGWGESSP